AMALLILAEGYQRLGRAERVQEYGRAACRAAEATDDALVRSRCAQWEDGETGGRGDGETGGGGEATTSTDGASLRSSGPPVPPSPRLSPPHPSLTIRL